MIAYRTSELVLIIGTVLSLAGCKKDGPEVDAPLIGSYRTYDLVSTAVKEDPTGGYVLLCKRTPIDRRNSFLQLVDPNGDPGQRIDLDALPRMVENVNFDPDELLFTDFIPMDDGSFIVVGIGRQISLNDRLHVVVYQVARNGSMIRSPFRRFLVESGVVNTNRDGASQDLNGLPRIKALCTMLGDDGLVVAARWETSEAAGVRLFRFSMGNSIGSSAQDDIPLPASDDRLHALVGNPNSHFVVLVADSSEAGTAFNVMVHQRSVIPGGWTVLLNEHLGIMNAQPQQLMFLDGLFILLGHRPDPGNTNTIRPFVTRFGWVDQEVRDNLRILDLSTADKPVTAYSAVVNGGVLQVLTNTHQASALQPFFDGDITSDLSVTDLDWPSLNQRETSTVLPGQGLRPIGYFANGGQRVVIGSQHPYLNGSYIHTFRLTLD